MNKVNILAPDIWEKDAVGNFCIDLAKLLVIDGFEVNLFAQNYDDNGSIEIRHIDEFFNTVQENDIIFLSYSIFDNYLEKIISLPNKKIAYFHGVTPPELLEEFEAITAQICRKSMDQFHFLEQFDYLIANSRYTAKSLQKYVGKKFIEVAPPVFLTRQFAETLNIKKKEPGLFLVVGRIVPHKRIEDAIKIFEKLSAQIDGSKLIVIGDAPNSDYNHHLSQIVGASSYSERISFVGKVDDELLKSYYLKATFLINASLHEGYGIPILEAIFYRLYVVLRDGSAMKELITEGSLSQVFTDVNDVEPINFLETHKNEQLIQLKTMLGSNANFFINLIKSC